MRYLLISLLLLYQITALTEEPAQDNGTVYRSIDEDGSVQYSDKPTPDSEAVKLQQPTILPATPVQRPATTTIQKKQQKSQYYQSLRITRPGKQETLRGGQGIVEVSVAIQPALQDGHQLEILLDGNAQRADTTSLTLQNVYRGEHQLQARILDAQGKALLESERITFFMHRPTVAKP